MGRWSRRIAPEFLNWLEIRRNAEWVDIGAGTGVLSSMIVERWAPKHVTGVDPSQAFVEAARSAIRDERFQCDQGSGESLPYAGNAFDVAVSGLVLNFVPDKDKALAEMARVVNTKEATRTRIATRCD